MKMSLRQQSGPRLLSRLSSCMALIISSAVLAKSRSSKTQSLINSSGPLFCYGTSDTRDLK